MTKADRRPRSPLRARALATVLAAALAGCAASATDGSGSSLPGGIDYHSGPYRMQNG